MDRWIYIYIYIEREREREKKKKRERERERERERKRENIHFRFIDIHTHTHTHKCTQCPLIVARHAWAARVSTAFAYASMVGRAPTARSVSKQSRYISFHHKIILMVLNSVIVKRQYYH